MTAPPCPTQLHSLCHGERDQTRVLLPLTPILAVGRVTVCAVTAPKGDSESYAERVYRPG
jgi:hypothetical protein